MSMSQPGQRVTIKNNAAMADRINEVVRTEGEPAARAYVRLAMRRPVCRVVDSAKGSLALRTQGSARVFVVPTGAVTLVKTVKSWKSVNKSRRQNA